MSTPPPDANDANDDRTVIKPPPPPPARSDHGNALPVGTFLGEFELTRVVGEGGFGIVYLAQDHSLQRRVALKEYMPSALAARTGPTTVAVKSERHRETFDLGLKSFVNEARLLAQFDHPALVKVYRFWEANGTAYMVMPFYEGTTLKDRLRDMDTAPDEAWLMGLLAPLTEALLVIHGEHCYHRDIAPDNIILLQGSGRPLLLDFGAARRVIGDMTQALTVILKPGYAPLEQYAEVPGMKQGPWTDVYALAAVVYYAITRRTPPPAVGRMVNDSYVPLAEAAAGRYSERFVQAIDRALRVKPDERTQSIEALREDLGLGSSAHETRTGFQATAPAPLEPAPASRGARSDAPASAGRPAPAAPSSAPPRSRTGLMLGLGGAGLVAAAVAAYVALTPKTPAPAPAPIAAAPSPGATPAPGSTTNNAPAPAPSPIAATPAPTPSPAASPAPAPAAPFSLDTEFDQVVQSQTPGFDVKAGPFKPSLRMDRDRLSFSVTSAREGHVYVLDHSPDGALTLLFPNSQDTQNRIRAGQTLTLPRASWPLQPSGPEGAEHLLVVVSAVPRDFSRLETGREAYFAKLPSGDAAAAAARAHTGPGSAFIGRADCNTPGCDAYGAAHFTVQITR
jgi:hypothetical protein